LITAINKALKQEEFEVAVQAGISALWFNAQHSIFGQRLKCCVHLLSPPDKAWVIGLPEMMGQVLDRVAGISAT
jgi:hypothetical protein